MKLQARLLLVYFTLFVGAVAFLIVQRSFDISRAQTVLAHELDSRKTYFGKLMSLEGNQLASFAIDYSYWDDMVTFVSHPTKEWGAQNIDTALSTFGTDAAWVYNTKYQLVYASASGSMPAGDLGLPDEAFAKLAKGHFEHFYIREPGGLMEIRAATIVPTSDYSHATIAQGYWFTGRYINDAYLKKMSDLAQSTVTLARQEAGTGAQTTSTSISFGVELSSWDGLRLSVMRLTAPVPVEKDLENLYLRQLLLLLLFFIASAAVLVGSIWRLVLRPVKTISAAIQGQAPERLDALSGERTEFGDLSQIVQLSFRQKIKIEESEFLKSKLEELNTSKAEFLAIAAHELRGPVGNINIFTANLAQIVDSKSSKKELQDELERISQQAHRANILINDMYQASKGGRVLEFDKQQVDFDKFIRREIDNAGIATNQKLELQGHTGQIIVTDPDRIGQVMTNLIRNAAKYSPTDKSIIIRLSTLGPSVQVEVEDFGIGIDPADQPKVFERFYRSSRVVEKYPGLGLGLSVCREIIENLGGKIWFESQLGGGSRFYFTLPAPDPAAQLS